MIRTYTMRLKINKRQEVLLSKLISQLCELYNMALQQRKNTYKEFKKNISYYDQQKQLTELRKEINEYQMFPAAIQRDPLRRIQKAFDGFFRRIKSGDTPGYPRFKSRDRYNSFSVDKQNFSLTEGSLKIVKLGGFKFKTKYKINGTPLQLTIKRVGNKWHANLVCDIGEAPKKVLISNLIGLDLGLTSLVTLSDGSEIANPRWTRREENKLAEANQSLSKKVKGSKNCLKSRERLRRIHQHIAGLRSNYLTEIAKQLVSKYDLIAHEDLNINQMVQSKFAKSIMDAAWRKLIWKLQCEAERAGKWVIPVDPRNTTKICSSCGKIIPKNIEERTHICPNCGLILGRDHNAALNILRLGKSLASKQNCIQELSI